MRRLWTGFEVDWVNADEIEVQIGSWTASGLDEPPRVHNPAVRVKYPDDSVDDPPTSGLGWWYIYIWETGDIVLSQSATYSGVGQNLYYARKFPLALYRTSTGFVPFQMHGPDVYLTGYDDTNPMYYLNLTHTGTLDIQLPLIPEESRLAHLAVTVVGATTPPRLRTPGLAGGISPVNGECPLTMITDSQQKLRFTRTDGIVKVGVRGWRWREPL